MCREAIKQFSGCRVTLRELVICANFVDTTFEHTDALAIDCPLYQSYNILLPCGRCSCKEGGFLCGLRSRDGERIVTFEERSMKADADEGKKYYEWREALENGARWETEVDSRKSHAIQELDSAYRVRLRAILEQEAIEGQPQAQSGQFRAPPEIGSTLTQFDNSEDYIDLDETEEDPDIPQDQLPILARKRKVEGSSDIRPERLEPKPLPKRQKVTQHAAIAHTSNQLRVPNTASEISAQNSPTSLNQILSEFNADHCYGTHLKDSIRYKYLGVPKTSEKWKTKVEKEKERISNYMQYSLAGVSAHMPGGKAHLKQERKIVGEGLRWECVVKEATTLLQKEGETRCFNELLLYANEKDIQQRKMRDQWGYVISRLNELSKKGVLLPDVLAEGKSTAAYDYIPEQTKTPHEWLNIVEEEKKRCVRAGARPNTSGRPVINQKVSKGELSRWDDMYREAAQMRESDARNIHEIVLDLNYQTLQKKEVADLDVEN